MYAAQLSISDRFVELGNLFFNIKNNDREFQYDLYYENTSQDPVNKFIVDNEERIGNFYKFINSIVDFVVGIFARQKTKTSRKFETNSDFNHQKMRDRNIDTFKNKLSSQQVIRNNIKNKLLQSISIHDNKNKNSFNKSKPKSNLPRIKLNYFFKEKDKVVVKNRFMGACSSSQA